MDLIPLPVAYGVGTGSLVLLFSFGVWFLRQLARGYDPSGGKHGLVPGSAVAQLVAAERGRADALLAEKDSRYTEIRESRDYYRQARIEERERAEAVTEKLADLTEENGRLLIQLLNAVQKAGEQ